ncbi:MAG: hypothetical protein WBG50_03390 [Desulfomonilaceae bacterium]
MLRKILPLFWNRSLDEAPLLQVTEVGEVLCLRKTHESPLIATGAESGDHSFDSHETGLLSESYFVRFDNDF